MAQINMLDSLNITQGSLNITEFSLNNSPVKDCLWLKSLQSEFYPQSAFYHPASRVISYGTYALYREKALHESCQPLVEHVQRVAKIQFRTHTHHGDTTGP